MGPCRALLGPSGPCCALPGFSGNFIECPFSARGGVRAGNQGISEIAQNRSDITKIGQTWPRKSPGFLKLHEKYQILPKWSKQKPIPNRRRPITMDMGRRPHLAVPHVLSWRGGHPTSAMQSAEGAYIHVCMYTCMFVFMNTHISLSCLQNGVRSFFVF